MLADLDSFFPLDPISGLTRASVIKGMPPAVSSGAVQTGEVTKGKLVEQEVSLNSPDRGLLPLTRLSRNWSWLDESTEISVELELDVVFFDENTIFGEVSL